MAVDGRRYVVGYAWPILNPGLDAAWRAACVVATSVVWVLFAADYCVRFALSQRRWRFIRHNFFDLAVIVLPMLRPLRLLRLVMLVRVLNRHTATAFRGRVALYVTSSAALVILAAALAVLDAERGGQESNITTFPDALWWAVTTVTTVGYGDHYPTTTDGRFVAVGVMLAGIALLGVVTATLAQWFIEQVERSEERTKSEIAELVLELARLRQQLANSTATSGGNKPV